MYKNYKLLLFLGAAIIFLYLSIGKYEEFSMQKSISACVYAQIKKNPGLKSKDAKLYCENEIKVKKNE